MKLFRHIITTVCVIIASFIAGAGEQLTGKARGLADQPAAVELQLLQGTWEGIVVGEESHEKITITITGNSLHFHRDTNFWFETTFTLPAGTDPKQLRATIKGCPTSQADSTGKVVGAIFKIEDGTLTLAAYDISDEPPKTFASVASRYVVKKVQPPSKNAEFAVFKSNDRGHSWMRSDAGIPGRSRINAFGSAKGILFAGTDSGIFTSRDDALSWHPSAGAARSSGRIISFATLGQRVFAGTDGNGLLVSSDGGASWALERASPSQKVRCLLAHEGKVYAGTDADGVLAWNDAGQLWTHLSAGLPAHAQVFALSAVKGRLFAGLYRRGLYAWDEQKQSWGKTAAVTPLALAVVQDTLIAGHNPGGISWSGDWGASWSKGVAENPAVGPFVPLPADDSGELSPEAPVWELGSDDGLVFAGASAGIYYSENRGRTWARAREGLPEQSPGIAFLLKQDFVLAGTLIKGSNAHDHPIGQARRTGVFP